MSRFSHLILTPFNLRTAGAPGLDAEWLADRFRLFESFCYPSVRAQTNQNFRWLVFLDVDTPEPFRRRMEGLRSYPALEPVYVRRIDDCRTSTLERVDSDASHLITTTLDNDDGIATTFVERVQREFRGQDFELINFVAGFRLDLRKTRLYTHRIRANPFISLIERNDEPKTIRSCGPHHLTTSRFRRTRDVETDPLWLQVVHGRNIAVTGVWGCRRVPLRSLESGFVLRHDFAAPREKPLPIGIENVRRTIERTLIDGLGRRGVAAARSFLEEARRLRARLR